MKVTNVVFMLGAQDMDRSIRFWSEAFGATKQFGSGAYTQLSLSGASVALHGGHDGSTVETGLNIEVDDIHAAAEIVAKAGGKVTTPPETRRGEPIMLGKCADTEGNIFGIVQNVR